MELGKVPGEEQSRQRQDQDESAPEPAGPASRYRDRILGFILYHETQGIILKEGLSFNQ